jgi:hypothetical protein
MIHTEKQLGDILVSRKMITRSQLQGALAEQQETREFLGAILKKKRWLTERQLADALGEQFQFPFVRLSTTSIRWELVMTFSPSLIVEYRCFPIARDDDVTSMAITNPLEAVVMRKANEEAKGCRVRFLIALDSDMDDLIYRYRRQVSAKIRRLLAPNSAKPKPNRFRG